MYIENDRAGTDYSQQVTFQGRIIINSDELWRLDYFKESILPLSKKSYLCNKKVSMKILYFLFF